VNLRQRHADVDV